MGQSLKRRAKKHGLWPESEMFRGKNFQRDRAEARRKARRRVGKPRRDKPWKTRFKRRTIRTESGEEKVFWDKTRQ